MKPTKEIIGLRIINISDGTQIGVVKDLVLNPKEKTLDFMIVDQPTDYLGAKIIAFQDLLGLGEFAITIPHPGVIQDVAQNIDAQNLLKQETRVLGTKVLTKKGQLIGVVKEILIDEETGQIAACLFEADDQMHEIKAEHIITLGKELLIVEKDPSDQNQQAEEPNSDGQIPAPDGQAEQGDSAGNLDLNGESEIGFNLFEQRQLQYFIDKMVDKDIILNNGEVLHAGELITPEMVTHITSRSTLMEITSNLRKN